MPALNAVHSQLHIYISRQFHCDYPIRCDNLWGRYEAQPGGVMMTAQMRAASNAIME